MTDASSSRAARRYGSWIPGLVLIGMGLVFLIQNYLGREIHNWWALFILIPVFFMLERGYEGFQAAGRPKRSASSWVASCLSRSS